MRKVSIQLNKTSNHKIEGTNNSKKLISRKTAPLILKPISSNKSLCSKKSYNTLSQAKCPIRKKQWKIVQMYSWLLQFFNFNTQKLANIVRKQLEEKSYFYKSELIYLVFYKKCRQNFCEAEKEKLLHELNKFLDFLIALYQKKKIKDILILEERLKEEEKYIEPRMESKQYEQLYKDLSLSDPPRKILDLHQNYQSISTTVGDNHKALSPHHQIKAALQTSATNLYRIFEGKIKKKGSRKFIIKASKNVWNNL